VDITHTFGERHEPASWRGDILVAPSASWRTARKRRARPRHRKTKSIFSFLGAPACRSSEGREQAQRKREDTSISVKNEFPHVGLTELPVGAIFKFVDDEGRTIVRWSEKGNKDWTLKAAKRFDETTALH